jgi:crossover junction endodeoxyribonuclease RuvC
VVLRSDRLRPLASGFSPSLFRPGVSATLADVGISAQQFERLQSRVSGAGRRPDAGIDAPAPVVHSVILGIDPSLRGTGYGVIRLVGKVPSVLAFGTVKNLPTLARSRCLAAIAAAIREVIQQHAPTACAVEGLFFAQNIKTAIIMGEARGASLVAAAEAGLEVCEIAPRKAKQAIVGFGGAGKLAVARMVQRMLNLAEEPEADAADALALALAFAQSQGSHVVARHKSL